MGDHAAHGGQGKLTGPAPLRPEPSPEAIEAGRRLFAQSCDFVAGVVDAGGLPPGRLPEVAFAGRSNVGKSSLINALTGRKTLARTSHTPGRTRQLNLFDLGGRLMLVDMPGYGYAEASKREIARWTALIRAYLKGRVALRRLCLLVDGRHGLKPSDRELMDMLDQAAVAYQIVLTKTDKVADAALAGRLDAIAHEIRTRTAAIPQILPTSARDGRGVVEFRAELAMMAEAEPIR